MRRLLSACTLIAALLSAVSLSAPATARPSVAARVEQAGNRLDDATERYDEARLRRATLDKKLASARTDLAVSEAKLAGVRKQLGVTVRDLYMHPAGGLGTFFQAKSYSEIERGSALGGRVALGADALILQIRRVKAEESSAASRLKTLRDEAKADEIAINKQRIEAARAYAVARALYSANKTALDAQRRAELAAAGGLAAANIKFVGPVRATAAAAVRAAASQIGKPYRWGAAGPDSYDCSGLTMWAWAHAGVSLPHSSRAQYASLPHVPLSQLAPGDLVFFGSPIHHVSIYKGGGIMIDAPHTGAFVREESVWRNPVGAARP